MKAKATRFKIQLTSILLLVCFCCFGQDSLIIKQPSLDTILTQPYLSEEKILGTLVKEAYSYPLHNTIKPNKSRQKFLIGANLIIASTSIYFLYKDWYNDYPSSKFHFFNDNGEWEQVDKLGHVWSGYTLANLSTASWQWAGINHKKSILYGTVSSLAYLSIIETLDGISSAWGFSWGDFSANIIGNGIFALQELGWKEQRIQVKFSSHINDYSNYGLNPRADSIFGKNYFTRTLKDYNAQTYWLSINIKSFFKQSKIPAWLNIAVGYGAEDMFAGSSNTLKDNNGNIIFDRSDIERYRQFYIAPDIDLTKIKTKSKFLKTTLFMLNSIKFPMPTLEFSQGNVKGHWIYF
jgi:hypothetical protein